MTHERENSEELVVRLLEDAARHTQLIENPEPFVERTLRGATDLLLRVESPLGELYVGTSTSGVRFVRRGGPVEKFARDYRRRFGRLLAGSDAAEARELVEKVTWALAGGRAEVPLDLSPSTPFQRRVLEVVSGIPRGEVRPYVWVAREAGSSKASRAVGNVMANNPVPAPDPLPPGRKERRAYR